MSNRKKISQKQFPRFSLEEALRIPRAIWEQYGGDPTPPHDVAIALQLSPTSGRWRNLCGAAIAYGLTKGGYNAQYIEMLPLAKRILAPTEPGDDIFAKREAILMPAIMRAFYEKYDRKKFPDDEIAKNVLFSMGIPKERADKALEILKRNGEFAKILRETKTGLFVALDIQVDSADQVAPESRTVKPKQDLTQKDVSSASSVSVPLHLNIQIHISPEMPSEKIDKIFESIAKHLRDLWSSS